MTLIADILMIAGALGAAFYCLVLSRRLRRFADLEKGIGGAVAVLSVQVDDMNKSIKQAERAAAESAARLNELTARAEDAARRLELMLASMHDLPIDPEPAKPAEMPSDPVARTAPRAPRAGESLRPEPMLTRAGLNDTDTPEGEAPARTVFNSRRKLGEQAA